MCEGAFICYRVNKMRFHKAAAKPRVWAPRVNFSRWVFEEEPCFTEEKRETCL